MRGQHKVLRGRKLQALKAREDTGVWQALGSIPVRKMRAGPDPLWYKEPSIYLELPLSSLK